MGRFWDWLRRGTRDFLGFLSGVMFKQLYKLYSLKKGESWQVNYKALKKNLNTPALLQPMVACAHKCYSIIS